MPVEVVGAGLRRPVVVITASFFIGCFWGLGDPSLSPRHILAAFGLILLIFGALRVFRLSCREQIASLLVIFAVLLAGLLRGAVVADSDPGSRAAVSGQREYYEGVVSSDPEVDTRRGDEGRMVFDLDLSDGGETVSVALSRVGRLQLSYGDQVRVRGYLRRGRGDRGYVNGWIERGGVLEKNSADSLKGKLYRLRHRSARMLEVGIEDFPKQSGILKALVLGYRKGVPEAAREQFVTTGSLHIFAISGLHIGIACSFAIFILRTLRVPPSRWFPFLLIILASYTVMTGASSSAVRACTMALVFYGGAFLGRKADVVSALALSALLIVIVNPTCLVDPGFVLSFLVASGICFLGGAMMDRFSKILADDPFLPPGRRKKKGVLVRWLAGMVAVSVSAWMVSAPLMLFFFGRLSLCGIVSNIVIVPIAFLTVLCGCCSLVFGNVSLLFSDIFNHASLGLILLLESVIGWFAAVPAGSISGVHIGLSQVLLWYLFLAVLGAMLRGYFAPPRDCPETPETA